MLDYFLIGGTAYGIAYWIASTGRAYWRSIAGFLLALIAAFCIAAALVAVVAAVEEVRSTMRFVGTAFWWAVGGAGFGVSKARKKLALKHKTEETVQPSSTKGAHGALLRNEPPATHGITASTSTATTQQFGDASSAAPVRWMPTVSQPSSPPPVPQSDAVPTGALRDVRDGKQGHFAAVIVLMLMVGGVAFWLKLPKTPAPDEAVVAVVSRPWTALSDEQLKGIYSEPKWTSSSRQRDSRWDRFGGDLDQADLMLQEIEKFSQSRSIQKTQSEKRKEQQAEQQENRRDRANLSIYQEKAEAGDLDAQHQMARIYEEGKVVKRSDALASHWHWRAAIQGSIDDHFYLGLCILDSQCEGDSVRARAWFNLAADKGDPYSQYWMMKFYHLGRGVAQDFDQANRWALKAAMRGHAGAQYYVGLAYSKGRGIRQDNVQAHKWLNLSAAQGGKRAGAKRDELEKIMSSGEITESQRLASAWRATSK